ncbi:MAG: exodeoxyribonuclease VII large subunit, partial [Pseudomonadota bacterium]
LRRRAPMIRVIIYPTALQGADAPREIVSAINVAASRNEVDALLICRGGGATEDLWVFNNEAVARAIHRLRVNSKIVVVSGIGHETDFTICDFVADARAPTPTAGAEMLSPDTQKLFAAIQQHKDMLLRGTIRLIRQHQQRLDFAARTLSSPQDRLMREREKNQRLQLRLQRALHSQYQQQRSAMLDTKHRLHQARLDIAQYRRGFVEKTLRLRRSVSTVFDRYRIVVIQRSQALNLLNPDNVLSRGYAIVRLLNNGPDNHVPRVASGIDVVHVNDLIAIRLHDGDIEAVIMHTTPKKTADIS